MLGAECRTGGANSLSRILVIGGYGGFGARLSRRLLERGHKILVAGRSEAKARQFCTGLPNALPVRIDREGDISTVLETHQPDIVIDAAGPFQGSDYRVPRACIAAGISYVDLADARLFVTGIHALDDAARAAGVVVVTGASSVPALSGAVARWLADGIDEVRSVDISISASNRATAGSSVAAAILSYVGKPIRLWRGKRWDRAWGWQELRREAFILSSGLGLRGRWVALADVPDHDLMPNALPGCPAVTFRAGTEITFQTIGLWLLSWPIRWFSLGGLPRLAPWLLPLQRLTRRLSSDRSAMSLRIKGRREGAFVQRTWTLIADRGDGPEIPTLAAVLVAELIEKRGITPGARDSSELLSLPQFEPLFESLAVRQETLEEALPLPLYRRVMGERFDDLPSVVRDIHDVCGDGGASGEATVRGGGGLLTRTIAKTLGFPRPGTYQLHVGFSERNGIETWTRSFGAGRVRSRLTEHRGQLVEQFGALRFFFDLRPSGEGLEMSMTGWSCFRIPLPLSLAPRSEAREWQEGRQFRFDVPISLPLIGLVVHYTGWLLPDVTKVNGDGSCQVGRCS